jgi:hypothetical protein
MATKNMAYDHPAYLARLTIPLPVSAAGSGAIFARFTAFTNMMIMSIGVNWQVAGTSTYTLSGTATNPATQFSVIRIFNTSTTTVALSTSTYGPFTCGGPLSNAIGGYSNFAVNNTGTLPANAIAGGLSVNAGDQIYCVNGTDASVTYLPAWEVNITPTANVTL